MIKKLQTVRKFSIGSNRIVNWTDRFLKSVRTEPMSPNREPNRLIFIGSANSTTKD